MPKTKLGIWAGGLLAVFVSGLVSLVKFKDRLDSSWACCKEKT